MGHLFLQETPLLCFLGEADVRQILDKAEGES